MTQAAYQAEPHGEPYRGDPWPTIEPPLSAARPAPPAMSVAPPARPPLTAPADPIAAAEANHPGHAYADDARRSFLRMVSHELRTPLNAIIGFSEIISTEMCGPLSPQYREYGEIIRSSGHRLLKLVNQTLEIVKLEGGSLELQPSAELLDLVFADAERACADELAQRGLTVQVDLPEPVPAVLADAKAIRNAVVNLVQNACVYAPEGGVVRLSARVMGPLVQLAVTDAGEGIDPAEVPRLMRPFEQGENALVRRAEGAGLGWPVVELICKAMGGRFEIETAPGRGLSALITLRRAG
ncbi:MAG: HAMP domain-containing histidine kinase [Proteobacteria bacterium]|nr:HAMP domain-containing histidine kinase [Pseudomonadota bacterium]